MPGYTRPRSLTDTLVLGLAALGQCRPVVGTGEAAVGGVVTLECPLVTLMTICPHGTGGPRGTRH